MLLEKLFIVKSPIHKKRKIIKKIELYKITMLDFIHSYKNIQKVFFPNTYQKD